MSENLKYTNRRNLLKWGFGLSSVALFNPFSKTVAQNARNLCLQTPVQPEGPFYPMSDQVDKDSDLTFVKGKNKLAQGKIIWVQGQVSDENCRPVPGVVVEIWQACASGKYNHPGDIQNPAPLDPNFQYWGRSLSDEKGNYQFKTILPGAYPAGEGWIRPPHIHFKVHKLGFLEITTQMYFKGEIYNQDDRILQRLSKQERELVVVDLEKQNEKLVANFPLTLVHV